MPLFLVRKKCEYTLVVDADNADSALSQTENSPLDHWARAWSRSEVETYVPPKDSYFSKESKT